MNQNTITLAPLRVIPLLLFSKSNSTISNAKSNFCLHPVKGEFSKRNRKRPYKFRVDLLIACSNQNKQMSHISLFFKIKLSKKTILGIYPNKDHYEVNVLFSKHLLKDKNTLYTSAQGSLQI